MCAGPSVAVPTKSKATAVTNAVMPARMAKPRSPLVTPVTNAEANAAHCGPQIAPAAMTDRTWYLYWIAVRKALQARGAGGELLRHAEDDARRERGRLLLIETSSMPHYELTRRFYGKHGYEEHAVLRDYYAAGDDMVVFRKRLEA